MKKCTTEKVSLEDVLFAINHFSTNVDQRFNTMDQRFDAVDQRFDAVDQRFEKIDQRFDRMDIEIFSIRTNMATKQDIVEVRSEMQQIRDETMTAIDGFAVLYQKFDMELVALRSRFIRMETFMHKVAERLSMQGEMI